MGELTRESSIERYAVRRAEAAGWVVRKVQWIGRRGAPDRVFFGHGRCVFVEFKRPGQVVEGLQKREFERLRAVYPEVYQCDSVEQVLSILEIER